MHFSVFRFLKAPLGLFKTQIVELYPSQWPWKSLRAISLSESVSWRLGASVCLRKNNLGLCTYEKEWKSKAFVKTIWCFYWSMLLEHMEALRKRSPPCWGTPGRMRRCVTNPHSSQHAVWDTWARFTDEFVKPGSDHHLLPVYSTNWVVWETLQVCLREEGNEEAVFLLSETRKIGKSERTCSWQQMCRWCNEVMFSDGGNVGSNLILGFFSAFQWP